jgi:signal transduction histidine kinase
MRKLFLLSVIILFSGLFAFSQTTSDIDVLNQKAEKLLNYKTDSAIFFAKQAIVLSETHNYIKGKSEGLAILCFASYIAGDYDTALISCNESIQSGKNDITTDLTLAYHALGLIRINQGQNDEAIKWFSKLTEQATKVDNMHVMADACANIGLAYLNKKFFQSARNYLMTALDIYEKIEHPHSQAFALLNYGRLFFEQNEFDSAKFFLNESVKIAQEINNERAILHAFSMLGQINLTENVLDSAKYFFNIAYEYALTHDLLWEKANLSAWLSEANYKAGDYHQAIKYGEIAIELAKKAHIIYILQKINNIIAKSYIEIKDFKAAENHVNYLETLIDSLSLADSSNLLRSIIDVNIFRQEEQNLQLVSNQLAIAKAALLKRNLMLTGTILTLTLLVVILGLIFNSNHIKTKNNEKLQELNEEISAQKEHLEKVNKELADLNKEKDLLLGIVAHDIRSPLNKISGLVNILQLEANNTRDQNEIFNMIQGTIKDANRLADELLEINVIEAGSIHMHKETLKMSSFIQPVIDQYKAIARGKNIKIELIQKCEDVAFSSDRKLLQRVLQNLLSNAIKFSEKNTTVHVELDFLKNQLHVSIIDQGPGIPEAEHPILFTKFGKTSVRPTDGETSNGLGLYIVDQLVKTLGGSLTFKSTKGKGSLFKVILPVS